MYGKLVLPIIAAVNFVAATTFAEESASTESASPSSQSDREWAKRTNKLNVLEQKIKDLTAKIQNMIRANNEGIAIRDEKGNTLDPLQAMTDYHRELKKTVGEYNSEKSELKYRFPEEGALIERRYVPVREQSLEDIAKEIGIEGDLKRLKAKIEKKYEPITGPKPTEAPQKPKAPESTIKDTKAEKPDRLKLVY